MEAFLCRLCIMIICSATGISGSVNLTRLLQAPAQMDQYTLVCRSDGRTDGGRVIKWFRSGSKIFQTNAGPRSSCSMTPIQDVYNDVIKGDVTVSCEPTMHTVTFTLRSRADVGDEWWCQDQAGGQTGTSNHLELGPTAITTHGLSTHGPSSYAMANTVTTITLPGGESSNTEEFSASTGSYTLASSSENTSPPGSNSRGPRGSSTIASSTDNTSSPGTKSPSSTGSSTIASSTENMSPHGTKSPSSTVSSTISPSTENTSPHGTKSPGSTGSSTISPSTENTSPHGTKSPSSTVSSTISPSTENTSPPGTKSPSSTVSSTISPSTENTSPHGTKSPSSTASSTILPSTENTSPPGTKSPGLTGSSTITSSTENTSSPDRKPRGTDKVSVSTGRSTVTTARFTKHDDKDSSKRIYIIVGSVCGAVVAALAIVVVVVVIVCRRRREKDAASSVERLGHGHTEGSTCETRIESDPDYQEKIVMEDNNLYVRSSEVLPLDPSRNAENTDAADVYAKVNKGQENKTEELTSL